MGKVARAYGSGCMTARAIIEMVNLMYQNNTAKNFYDGLVVTINRELLERCPEFRIVRHPTATKKKTK